MQSSIVPYLTSSVSALTLNFPSKFHHTAAYQFYDVSSQYNTFKVCLNP